MRRDVSGRVSVQLRFTFCADAFLSLLGQRSRCNYLYHFVNEPKSASARGADPAARGPAERELELPVWNALYQIRDFSQFVNWVRAKDRAGRPLADFRTGQEPLAV